jgi:hypothetical protein
MISFRIIGAALVFAAMAGPASAQVSEPAAVASQNPSFSIYSSGGYASGPARPMTSQPFITDSMAQMRVPMKPHRAHRAPVKRY